MSLPPTISFLLYLQVKLIGVCVAPQPWLVVLEYIPFGDLRNAVIVSSSDNSLDLYASSLFVFNDSPSFSQWYCLNLSVYAFS